MNLNQVPAASYLSRDAAGRIGGKLRVPTSPGVRTTIEYAIVAYGFLVGRNETIDLAEFSRRIARTYDCEHCAHNKLVVQALSTCQ